MTVTQLIPKQTASLTLEQRASIKVAVAQWLRSAKAVAAAQTHLTSLGVDAAEIVRRRRAESADRGLARILRFALHVLITRGRLEPSDRRLLANQSLVPAVVDAVAESYASVLAVESATDTIGSRVAIDLEVGDY